MRARADNRYGEPLGRAYTRPAGSGYCRARGGSRGLLPQAGAAAADTPAAGGKPLTLDGPWRRWLLVQVTEDLSAQVTEGSAVPGPVSVSLITCGCHRAAG